MIKIRLLQKQMWSSHDRARCQTLNPSALRHCRWASMNFPQASSPFCTMQSSLSFFVSGQAQQIFFFGLVSGAGAVVAGGSAETEASVFTDAVFPISEMKWNSIRSVLNRIGQDDQWLDYLQHKILMNSLLLFHAIHVLQNWNIYWPQKNWNI